MQNNFDFNKLFDKGISYGRIGNKQAIRELCRQKVTKTLEMIRSCSVLSKSHQKQLDDMMDEIEKFVFDPTTEDRLVYQI